MTWYKKGLNFECTGCGQCCTGSPGAVWLDDADIDQMTAYLNISREEFIKRYTRLINGHLSLLEFPRSYDCVFLRDKKCLVYGARPKQCRTFPFWPENLTSKESWEETAQRCEGINDSAPLISLAQIEQSLEDSLYEE